MVCNGTRWNTLCIRVTFPSCLSVIFAIILSQLRRRSWQRKYAMNLRVCQLVPLVYPLPSTQIWFVLPSLTRLHPSLSLVLWCWMLTRTDARQQRFNKTWRWFKSVSGAGYPFYKAHITYVLFFFADLPSHPDMEKRDHCSPEPCEALLFCLNWWWKWVLSVPSNEFSVRLRATAGLWEHVWPIQAEGAAEPFWKLSFQRVHTCTYCIVMCLCCVCVGVGVEFVLRWFIVFCCLVL